MAFDEMADLLAAIALLESRMSRDPEEELVLLKEKVEVFSAEVGHQEGELLGFLATRGDYETPDKEDDAIDNFYQQHAVMTELLNERREELHRMEREAKLLEGRLASIKRMRERIEELQRG